MPLTHFADQLADAREVELLQAQKEAYRQKILALQCVVVPSLNNIELGAGLGLNELGDRHGPVSRFLSDKPRNRRARPDTRIRGIIDLLMDGTLFLAVQYPATPGARRHVVVAEARDVPLMDRTWTVHNLAGLLQVRRGRRTLKSALQFGLRCKSAESALPDSEIL